MAIGSLALASCRTKLNPALDGFTCNHETGICLPRDSGLDGDAGIDSDVAGDRRDAADTGGDADVDADAGAGAIFISAPGSSPTFTNGTVAVQVSFAPGTVTPPQVELLRNDTHLAVLSPPFSFSWDTTAEAEGTYTLTAGARIGDRAVTSQPVTIIVDRTPPTVILATRVPAPGASEVALTDSIQLMFSEPILPTVASSAVVVSQASGPITTNATLALDGKSLSIAIPDRSVVALTAASPATLSATVSTAVKDLAGNTIVDPPTWSWTVPLWLDFGSIRGEAPSLTLDASGTPFVSTAFEPGAIGSHVYALNVSRHIAGTTWDASVGSPQTSNTNILYGVTSVIAGKDDRPIVGWSETPMGGTASIHVAHWSGSTWDTTYPALDQVAGSSTDGFAPFLMNATSDQFFVAWAEMGTSSVTDVHTARWTGSAWVQFPALGVIGATTPVLATSGDGQPIVGWVAGLMMAGVSTWTGQAWATSNYPPTYWSSLALDKTHRPVVAFVDGSSVRVRYVDANAEEYAPAISTSTQASTPRIAIDTQDRAVVVWSDSNGTTRDVKVARWTGTEWDLTFGVLSAVAAAGSNAAAPVVALDASDAPIVAWQELDPVRNTTYVRKSNR